MQFLRILSASSLIKSPCSYQRLFSDAGCFQQLRHFTADEESESQKGTESSKGRELPRAQPHYWELELKNRTWTTAEPQRTKPSLSEGRLLCFCACVWSLWMIAEVGLTTLIVPFSPHVNSSFRVGGRGKICSQKEGTNSSPLWSLFSSFAK